MHHPSDSSPTWPISPVSPKSQIEALKAEIAELKKLRQAERAGRIKSEQECRLLRLTVSANVPATDTSTLFQMRAIGFLKSPYDGRNGCPRQPHLVPAGVAKLQLAPHVPTDALDGLAEYSHCWVLYVFHQNTDLGKNKGVKGKIAVPRLNGEKVGCLATRSPHRPNPIGLSTARIISIDSEKGVVVLGGIDIVNNSPILDLKPFLPFADGLLWTQPSRLTRGIAESIGPGSVFAPDWVTVQLDDDPVFIDEVLPLSSSARTKLVECFTHQKEKGVMLYDSPQEFEELVKQCLSRDIRSLHKRLNWNGNAHKTEKAEFDPFHVVLNGIDISYVIKQTEEKVVEVVDVFLA